MLVPVVDTLPQDGFSPTISQVADGIRTDPPPSDPSPMGTSPHAIAAAVPDELPDA